MATGLYLQYVVIAVLVLTSLVVTIRKIAPAPSARLLGAVASNLDQPHRTGAARALGRWLRPAQATGDCSDGCSTCGSCDRPDTETASSATRPASSATRPTTRTSTSDSQPLIFHAPSKRHD